MSIQKMDILILEVQKQQRLDFSDRMQATLF